MVRSIISVVVGYLTTAISVMLLFVIIKTLMPDSFPVDNQLPATGILVIIQIGGFLCAMLGGFAAVKIATENKMKHLYALMILFFLMGIVSLITMMEIQPIWYLTIQSTLGIIGVYVGGKLSIK